MTTYETLEDLTTLIASWEQARIAAGQWKEREMELRKLIVSRAFPAPKVGTQSVFVTGGKLTLMHKLTYTLGDAASVSEAVGLVRMLGGSHYAERIIQQKPQLNVTFFKSLPTHLQKLLTDPAPNTEQPALTIKDAAPYLTAAMSEPLPAPVPMADEPRSALHILLST